MSELGLFLFCTVGALLCIGILLYFFTGPTSYDVIYGYEYIPDKNRVYSIKTKKFYRFKVEENYECQQPHSQSEIQKNLVDQPQ